MNIVIPKVQKWQLHEFLQSLHPDTIAEMWMILCDYHRYNYLPFMWDELEDMVRRNPNVAGIDLVDCEFDCDNSSVIAELVEDYLNELNGEDIGF
jgi:predicted nucleotide-binding protein (sugar kinase/HSP70/actin superfamily)